jgi:multiple sugar transport system substrate-binding protein
MSKVLYTAVFLLFAASVAFATGAQETEAEGGGTAQKPVELSFWHYWDGANGEVLQGLIDEYEAANPNVTINAEFVPGSDLGSKLQTAIVGGQTPNLSIADLVLMPRLTKSGSLVPMDDYIAGSTIDLSDFFQGPLVYGEHDNQRYSLPVSASNLGLFWNKELFEAAGLDPDTPPATWSELVSMAQTIKQETGVWGMELFTEGGEGTSWQWQVYLWGAGGDVLSSRLSQPAFDSAAGERALQFWVDLIHKHEVSTIAPWGLFGRGEAAMVMDGSWMTQFFPMQVDFELGSAQFPPPADGEAATTMGGEQIFIFESTEAKQQAAFDFIEWFVSTDVQVEWDKGTGFMPIRASVAESSDYLSWVDSERPLLKPFVEAMEHANPRPPVESYSQISDVLAQHIVEALHQRMTPAQALSAAASEVDAILE